MSAAANIASAAVSKPAKVKADQPQQLKSVTVYWRGRKMVLMQRPQRRVSLLLCRMLRRSWQNLFGILVRAIGAGALAAAAMSAHADTSTLPANTLPTGFKLTDPNSTSRAWQHHNHMTIKQVGENETFDWQSFSIGSGASVRFIQNDANAIAINRVTGNDPSIIMGSLTANGKIFLINAAGILVGKTGKIDVAGFVASTLNISDADVFSGKLNFAADPGKTSGDVKVEAGGTITANSGGSIYLVGANVENGGIITAPNGQVLLAAGSTVNLVDTSLPGVSIQVSGVDGKVTNLGQIIASAGTIGIGAALIDNSGIINASSVEREGGRIFLRATKQLTTDATSQINADGTTGGNVQLYSDQVANIDGDVSALGSAGNGGYVDTSGKTSLSVHYVPRVGPGGEWYIDPYDVEIVDDNTGQANKNSSGDASNTAITASGGSSFVHASTINTLLSDGTNVTISTGTGGDAGNGNITVGAAIIKSNSSTQSTLTLDSAHNITIYGNGGISDGSNATTNGGLSLVLNAGYDSTNNTSTGAISNVGGIVIGGNLTAHSASFSNGSMLLLNGGTATFSSDLSNNTNGTIAGVGTINVSGHTLINNAGVVRPGYGNGTGVLNVIGNYQQNVNGVLQSSVGMVAGLLSADQLKVTGTVNLAGRLQMTALSGYTPQLGDKVSVLNYGGQRTGYFDDSLGILLPTMFVNYLLLNTGSDQNVAVAYAPAGVKYFSGGAGTLNWDDAGNWSGHSVATSADVYVDTGDANPVYSAINRAIYSLTIASGEVDVSGGTMDVSNFVAVNGGVLGVTGGTLHTGELDTNIDGTTRISSGSVNVDGINLDNGTMNVAGGALAAGSLNVSAGATMVVNGSANVTVSGVTEVAGALTVSDGLLTTEALGIALAGTMNISGGNVNVTGTTSISGRLTVNGSGVFLFSDSLSGSGLLSIGGAGQVTLNAETDSSIGSIVLSGGTFNVNDNFAVSDLNISGGQINGATGKYFWVDGSFLQTGGTIGGTGSAKIGSGTFTQATGDLVVGNINADTNLILNAANGAIRQSDGTSVTSNTLSATATQGITLNNAANNVSVFTASNTVSGNIALNDAAISLLLNGSVTNNHGNISITNTGGISATAIHGEGGINGIDSSGTVTLSSTNGNVTLGRINAVNLNVSAAAGNISQESENTGGLTITGTMTANAATGIEIDHSFGSCGTNHVTNFSGTNTGSGDITLNTSGSNLSLAAVSNAGGNISVTDNDNSISVDGQLTANTGVITLSANSGAITESAGGGISTASLVASAADGIALSSGNNTVSALSASNTNSGNIALNDAAASLLLNGNVKNSADSDGADNGNISITNTGSISATAAHNGNGYINGIDSSGTVTLTSTGGNVTLGRINAANLTVSAAAGNISQELTSTGALTISNMMIANASSGITLDHAFGTCGTNRIAFFGATNTGSGDITLVNVDSDGVTNRLMTINNLGGNVSVNNTGALETGTDLVKASGTMSIATHSPLTIGSGGVTAGSGVTLTAGDGTSGNDVLTLNGAVQTTSGSVAFGGNTIFENAAVISPNLPSISSPNQPVQGAGYSFSTPPVSNSSGNGTISNQAGTAVSTTTDVTVTKTSQTNPSNTIDVLTPPVATTTSSTANTASDQTVGGSTGEFGGSDSTDDKKDTTTKSSKPAPICS
jgi:filamentous hemagglutinin family protein